MGGNNNPTGKGGFKDNPQNSIKGNWSKETSISYWQNAFIRMDQKTFESFENKPDGEKLMCQVIAYNNVKNSRDNLFHQKELSDRTEGKAQTYTDITSSGEKINITWIENVPDRLNE